MAAPMAIRCQAQNGILADMRSLKRVISFDTESGLFTAEAGDAAVRHHRAMQRRTASFRRWCPAAQFVTLGGAIANDVHGKNHHRRGTFGCHVEQIELLEIRRQDL